MKRQALWILVVVLLGVFDDPAGRWLSATSFGVGKQGPVIEQGAGDVPAVASGAAEATWDVCLTGCAFTRVQDAVDAAAPGDRVRVGQGTYVGPIALNKSVILEGGYSGPPSWHRSPLVYRTVLDGNATASVVEILNQSPTLDGFVITNGRGAGGTYGTGGGVYVYGASASPVINGNWIVENTAVDGGGIFVDDFASPIITNNIIIRNGAGSNGAGIYVDFGSQPKIINNVISDNSLGYGRQGIFTYNAPSPNVRNNIIISQRVGVERISGTMVLDHNDVWNNAFDYIGVTPDEHSVSVDPEFQEGSDNYHLRLDAPLIDVGAADGAPARDFEGDPRPLGAGTDIGPDESIFFGFTDDPLISKTTVVKAIHFTELSMRINALRVRFGLPPFTWKDTVLTGVTVHTVHLHELRDALVGAYVNAIAAGVNVTLPSFVDNPLAPQTVIKTIHVEQLRAAVLDLERA